MANGNTYGNFIYIAQQRVNEYKPRLKVNKKTEQKILHEIKLLQEQDSKLYENDDLSNEMELKIKEQSKILRGKIRQLIDSMYETKDEIKNRTNSH